jgi:hypothetical protein
MADAVRVPGLHFCEIGQEYDGVIVDVVTILVTMKDRAKDDAETGTSVRGSAAGAVPQSDLHHAAQEQT